MDLVTWLRAQLDDDERLAKAATPGPWTVENEYRRLPGCRCLSCYEEEPYGKAIHEIDAVGEDPSPILKPSDAEHIIRHDPARVLRDVEAKRQILNDCAGCLTDDSDRYVCALAFRTIRALALSFSDRPGYRDEWRL